MKILLNLILFQLTWMAAVGGAGQGLWWPGLVMLVVFAGWHLATTPWLRQDLVLFAGVTLGGFAVDTLLLQLGVLRYATPVPSAAVAPIWIVVLWAAFALTLNHSMRFLRGKAALGVLFGLLGGPLAYWVAAKVWGAAEFGMADWQSLLCLGLAWAILTPLLMAWAVKLVPQIDGAAPAVQVANA